MALHISCKNEERPLFFFPFSLFISNLKMTLGSILITGGTSLVGSAIIRQTKLESKYSAVHPVVAFSRSARPELSASSVHHVRGNVFDAMSLQSVIRNKPHVVHTVGLDEVDSSLLVANALADRSTDITHPEDRRAFIFFSVADGFPSLIFNQDFVHGKRQAEYALLGIKLSSKIRVVIFRPGKFLIWWPFMRLCTCVKEILIYFYHCRCHLFISQTFRHIALCVWLISDRSVIAAIEGLHS